MTVRTKVYIAKGCWEGKGGFHRKESHRMTFELDFEG